MTTTVEAAPRGRAVRNALHAARVWFQAFRHTRPFWGGIWSVVGGLWIIRFMGWDVVIAVSGGWSSSAGYILGGLMATFGLISWFAPLYKNICGVGIYAMALFAFVAANLGGFLIGSVLGIIGGSMIWSWGGKKPWEQTLLGKWQARRRAANDESTSAHAAEA